MEEAHEGLEILGTKKNDQPSFGVDFNSNRRPTKNKLAIDTNAKKFDPSSPAARSTASARTMLVHPSLALLL